jgi:hypothetical protein
MCFFIDFFTFILSFFSLDLSYNLVILKVSDSIFVLQVDKDFWKYDQKIFSPTNFQNKIKNSKKLNFLKKLFYLVNIKKRSNLLFQTKFSLGLNCNFVEFLDQMSIYSNGQIGWKASFFYYNDYKILITYNDYRKKSLRCR